MGDFEVFRPAGVTRHTDGGDIWRGGMDRPSVQGLWYGTPKTENFTEILPNFGI